MLTLYLNLLDKLILIILTPVCNGDRYKETPCTFVYGYSGCVGDTKAIEVYDFLVIELRE